MATWITTGTIAQNKKARFNYSILETIEAGIVLTGPEVKSLRLGHATIAESYASPENGDLFLVNAHILEYEGAYKGLTKTSPTRPRKLLLRQKELKNWILAVAKKGQTIVPLELYFNPHGKAKIKLGLAVGKNLSDKRQSVKERDWNRDKQRILAHYNNGKKSS